MRLGRPCTCQPCPDASGIDALQQTENFIHCAGANQFYVHHE